MQRMRHQGLAGSGFAVNQHMTIGLAQIQNILAQTLHHWALADEFFHQLTAI